MHFSYPNLNAGKPFISHLTTSVVMWVTEYSENKTNFRYEELSFLVQVLAQAH